MAGPARRPGDPGAAACRAWAPPDRPAGHRPRVGVAVGVGAGIAVAVGVAVAVGLGVGSRPIGAGRAAAGLEALADWTAPPRLPTVATTAPSWTWSRFLQSRPG